MKKHKWKKLQKEPHPLHKCEHCGVERTPISGGYEYYDYYKIGSARTMFKRPECVK